MEINTQLWFCKVIAILHRMHTLHTILQLFSCNKCLHFCTDSFLCISTQLHILICELTVQGVVGKRYGGVVDVSSVMAEV